MRAPMLVLVLSFTLVSCSQSYAPAATQVRSHAEDEKTEPYFAGPWPDDRRLIDGRVHTLRFPRPGDGALILNLLESGDRVLTGWGLSSPSYVPFTGPIDVSSLPGTPAEAQRAGASVFLTAVTPGSPAFGLRHPVDFHFFPVATLYLPANVLAVRPFPGVPLEPKTTYALVVTRAVRDAAGQPVGPEESLWNALRAPASDATASALVPALAALGVKPEDVAGAFLFTTQPIFEELLTLRDWLEQQPDPGLDGAHLTVQRPTFTVIEGTYQAPNLQHGVTPFALTGGDFEYDDAGVPTPAQDEAMRVAVCVPKGPVPDAGFPVVLYSHGTGGSFESVIDDLCAELASIGVAGVGIDQVFHGPRGGSNGGCFGMSVELCFFNPVNVVAGRNNSRQAALDNVMLRKLLSRVRLPAGLDPDGREVHFASERVGFFGHSQGGLSGALYTALAPQLTASVLSGAGGNLTTTVLVRKDPFDVKQLAEGSLILGIEGRESLDEFHPALALIQTFAEAADPSSYGRYYIARPQGSAKHVYLTSGMLDPYTSPFTAEVLAASAGIPQLQPVAQASAPHALLGLAPVAAPVQGDVHADDGRAATAALRQFPGQGHFPAIDDPSARAQWRGLFDQALHGQPVIIFAP